MKISLAVLRIYDHNIRARTGLSHELCHCLGNNVETLAGF